MTRTITRFAVAVVLIGLATLPLTPTASADEPSEGTKQCLAAYEKVQDLRGEGKLSAAEEQAIVCARGDCPDALSADCRQWLDQIKLSMPTVVFDVRDPKGAFVSGAKISVDGVLLTDKLQGRAVPIDPGARVIRAEATGFDPAELQLVIQEGQKNRKIDIAFKAPVEDEPVPTEGDGGVPVATWIFGGLAVAGLVVGGVFMGLGLKKKSQLEDCRPSCAGEDVDDMMAKLVVGDIALAAAVVSAAAALTIYLTAPDASSSAALVVTPTRQGAAGALQLRF